MSSPEQTQIRHKTVLDDEGRHIARVYAEALYGAAERVGQQVAVLEELDALVGGLFGSNPGLEVFLASPATGRDRKEAALKAAFGGRANEVFVKFLLVLNHHDRLGWVRAVAGAYKVLHERRSRRVRVRVTSAVPLNDEQRGRVAQNVRDVSGLEPVLEESINPELLGGLVIRIGDWVYDTSVRTKLDKMRDELIERSSHDIQRWRDRFSSH